MSLQCTVPPAISLTLPPPPSPCRPAADYGEGDDDYGGGDDDGGFDAYSDDDVAPSGQQQAGMAGQQWAEGAGGQRGVGGVI